jgi:hypothetical protein
MFSLHRWLFVLLLCLGAVGWYRGWFSVSSSSQNPDTNRINLSVDSDKVKADSEKAKQFTEKVAHRIKEERDREKAQDVK